MKHKDFSNIKTSLSDSEFNLNAYLNAEYLQQYSAEDMEFLNSEADKTLMINLGYQL